MKNSEKTLEMIVNLCKNRGYVYAGSEIYGGLANSWDYGPLGVEFKNNVKKAWLKKFVQESDYNVGLDAAIIMNPTTWVLTYAPCCAFLFLGSPVLSNMRPNCSFPRFSERPSKLFLLISKSFL